MTKIYKVTIVFYMFFFCNTVIHAQLSETAIKELRKSTVRVKSGSKVSTGFLWKNNNWVVTTLHSITQSQNIQITLVDQVRTAEVVKVLKAYDLALLKLDKPVTLPILNTSNTDVKVNSNLFVLGYNGKGNLSTIIDRSLRLGYNSSGKLKGLLSSRLNKDLAICKSPDPNIDILYFDGSLLPGFSGSPIVDNSGKLIGIADGGLEEGAQSISWGINVKFLNSLSISSEQFQNTSCTTQSNTIKFSSENLQDDVHVDYIVYNDYKFIKTKTRTIAQMQYTIDDPQGLSHLISSFSMTTNLDYLSFSYDIYTDSRSGATLCVPEGTKLKVQNDILVGQIYDSNLAYVAWPNLALHGLDKSIAHQNASITFENKIIAYTKMNLEYQIDYNYSYKHPIFKPNGLKVNRKSFTGYSIDGYGNYYPQTYLFETHITYKDTYLGMSVINLKSDQEFRNKLNSCVYAGQCFGSSIYPECNGICKNYKIFSQLVLGVHMGGFSNIGY